MKYSVKILRGNMPEVNIKVEADNVYDALENKMHQNPDFNGIDKNTISDVYVEIDDTTFPVDGMALKGLDNGEWCVSFDDSDTVVLFKELEFTTTAHVASENGTYVEQNSEEDKELIRQAADWVYCMGFAHIASKYA